VKAGIPANTTVEDIAGGTQNGNDIEWKIESLKANSSGKIQYKVKVNLLEVPEISSSATASITASGTLINRMTMNQELYSFFIRTVLVKTFTANILQAMRTIHSDR